MQRGLAIIALIGALVLFSGCTGQPGAQTPEEMAMSNATVKLFTEQYPSASVSVTHYDKAAFANIAAEIKADCGNPYFSTDTPREFYKVVITDPSGDYILAWIDGEAKKIECLYRKGQKPGEKETTGAAEKPAEGGNCVAGWACKDSMHKAYRNEDCNWEGEKFCDYGCGAGRCLASDEEGASAGNGTAGQQTGDGAETGVNADTCAGVVCSDVCEGNVRKFRGYCVNGDCNYSTTKCFLGCENGLCKSDPCATVECPNTCEGDFANIGKCEGGSCNYEQVMCENGCIDGACREAPEDAQCAGIVCANVCDGSTSKHNGVCANGACSYSTTACELGCENGLCKGDPCAGVSCPNICENITKKLNGACVNGACQYSTTACTYGCKNATSCNSYLCGGNLTGPFPNKIMDYDLNQELWGCTAMKKYCKTGTPNCCEYSLFGGGFINCIDCRNGGCLPPGTNLCANVTCAPNCTGNTRNYNGQCNQATGACTYSAENCANGCTNGVCNADPCAGVSCPDICGEDTKKFNGACVGGFCNYSAIACTYGCKNATSCNTYSCAGTITGPFPNRITDPDTNQELWGCTTAKQYCQPGTPNCCTYSPFGGGFSNCMDCRNGGCTTINKPVGTIFITNGTWTGNGISGFAGANLKCAGAAAAASFMGTWKAIIGSPTQNAWAIVPDTVYRRVDGTVIANSKADLFDASIASKIELSELGVKYTANGDVWTGVNSAGFANSYTCGDWSSAASTGQIGNASQTNSGWISLTTKACNSNYAGLYCIRTN